MRHTVYAESWQALMRTRESEFIRCICFVAVPLQCAEKFPTMHFIVYRWEKKRKNGSFYYTCERKMIFMKKKSLLNRNNCMFSHFVFTINNLALHNCKAFVMSCVSVFCLHFFLSLQWKKVKQEDYVHKKLIKMQLSQLTRRRNWQLRQNKKKTAHKEIYLSSLYYHFHLFVRLQKFLWCSINVIEAIPYHRSWKTRFSSVDLFFLHKIMFLIFFLVVGQSFYSFEFFLFFIFVHRVGHMANV